MTRFYCLKCRREFLLILMLAIILVLLERNAASISSKSNSKVFTGFWEGDSNIKDGKRSPENPGQIDRQRMRPTGKEKHDGSISISSKNKDLSPTHLDLEISLPSKPSFLDIANKHRSYQSKYHHIYEKHISNLLPSIPMTPNPTTEIPKTLNILQIGLDCDSNAGPRVSYDLWHDYLPPGSKISFIESDNHCVEELINYIKEDKPPNPLSGPRKQPKNSIYENPRYHVQKSFQSQEIENLENKKWRRVASNRGYTELFSVRKKEEAVVTLYTGNLANTQFIDKVLRDIGSEGVDIIVHMSNMVESGYTSQDIDLIQALFTSALRGGGKYFIQEVIHPSGITTQSDDPNSMELRNLIEAIVKVRSDDRDFEGLKNNHRFGVMVEGVECIEGICVITKEEKK